MRKLLLLGILLLLSISILGCATPQDRIIISTKGVTFHTNREVAMSMKKDGAEYSYDSRTPSMLRTIIEAGVVKGMSRE